ncbi:OB-fold nucleic acid binding domain-containing protein [Candidatus Pacearchaeota archaeon]|nr:OB-fold nucleic acid binding domain-containing protein [Candidatus Pacearchaeota archaeon]
MPEIMQRATAYKLRIGDITRGKPILDGEKFKYLELDNRQIVRASIVANIIERYEGQGEKKYLSFTIDDASGQIRLKIFGEDVEKYKEIAQGNTVVVVGLVRFYNNEVYIAPDLIRIQDPRYLLVRKLELEKDIPKEVKKEEFIEARDKIIEMIKKAEDMGGLETDKLVMELKFSPEIINKEIQKLLEEGLAYEPRPGKIRYLG